METGASAAANDRPTQHRRIVLYEICRFMLPIAEPSRAEISPRALSGVSGPTKLVRFLQQGKVHKDSDKEQHRCAEEIMAAVQSMTRKGSNSQRDQ